MKGVFGTQLAHNWHMDFVHEKRERYFGSMPTHLVERWHTPLGAPLSARGRGRGGSPRGDSGRRSAAAAGRAPGARGRGAAGSSCGRLAALPIQDVGIPDGSSRGGAPAGVAAALARAAHEAAGPAARPGVWGSGDPAGQASARSLASRPADGGPARAAAAPPSETGDDRWLGVKRPRGVPEHPLVGGPSRSMADVLAERARGQIAAVRPSSKGGSADSSAEQFVQLLSRALRGASDSGESDALGLGGAAGSSADSAVPTGVAAKRQHYRRVATEQPGKLFRAGLTTMGEQLSPLDSLEDETSEVPAIVLKYFLMVFMPQHSIKGIGVGMYRELRTLAEVMDLLIVGKTPEALDMLMQRMKACMMSIADRDWSSAKWLELIPPSEGQTVVSQADEELAQQVTLSELKLAKLRAELGR